MKKIELNDDEFKVLEDILKFFIYQPVPLYKDSNTQVKIAENILYQRMKVKEWCLIREDYIDHE